MRKFFSEIIDLIKGLGWYFTTIFSVFAIAIITYILFLRPLAQTFRFLYHRIDNIQAFFAILIIYFFVIGAHKSALLLYPDKKHAWKIFLLDLFAALFIIGFFAEMFFL
ncbi:hypothetical protein ACFL4J_00995 [Candidatus Margulisiibacteriota bacterium]